MYVTLSREKYEKLVREAEDLGVTVQDLIRLRLGLPRAKRTSRSRRHFTSRRGGREYVTINVYLPREVEERLRRNKVRPAKLITV